MDPRERLRHNVKVFYGYLGSVFFAGLAPFAARALIDTDTLGGRIGGVVVGTLGWIPIFAIVGLIVREGDEFWRRIHLVAIALTFGCGMVLLALLDWLVRAEFVPRPDLMVVWVGFAMLWVVFLLLTKRHYERQV